MLYLIIIPSNTQNKLLLRHFFWTWTGLTDVCIYLFMCICMFVCVCVRARAKYKSLSPCFMKICIGESNFKQSKEKAIILEIMKNRHQWYNKWYILWVKTIEENLQRSLSFINTCTYMNSSRAKCFEDWFLKFILCIGEVPFLVIQNKLRKHFIMRG